MTVDGTWTIRFKTPGGERQADLVLNTGGTTLTGSFDGTPIDDGEAHGPEFSFTAKLTSRSKSRSSALVPSTVTRLPVKPRRRS